MKCKYCENSTAMIVRRYKGHEYRYCKKCNRKYITHEENGEIIVDDEYMHRKQNLFKKGY
jgi:hypothetical protein